MVAASKSLRLIAGEGAGRIGIATAKALGSKPNRNLAKRRMREIVRCGKGDWRSQMDYIVVMKAESNRTPFEGLKHEAANLLIEVNKRWDSASESF
ncbi:MAG: ribonuclease P protein component [Fimbriimonadaceae bacterium]